ncbi:hypothetical protein cyc_05872 [Cyclospora cayetanensis]|uniref:Uncharacterized protein n=1 Tax=Cyclospora cayetanensis TaxID=88456 RepID=A0A1D3DAI2_9EIME|nr:hypothetical protein cyc_05872 [Cyclospora cayetanensis]
MELPSSLPAPLRLLDMREDKHLKSARGHSHCVGRAASMGERTKDLCFVQSRDPAERWAQGPLYKMGWLLEALKRPPWVNYVEFTYSKAPRVTPFPRESVPTDPS